MSTSSKVAVGVVAVAVILGGIWFAKGGKNAPASVDNTLVTATTTTTTTQKAPTLDEVAARDNSNDSLAQDMASLDAHMKAVDSGSAQVDQSLNDKPVAQPK